MTEQLLVQINAHLAERGFVVGKGTIVDATTANAPPSRKGAENRRDPEMHQTRNGNQT